MYSKLLAFLNYKKVYETGLCHLSFKVLGISYLQWSKNIKSSFYLFHLVYLRIDHIIYYKSSAIYTKLQLYIQIKGPPWAGMYYNYRWHILL
jgi:hypothetical protein